MWLTLIQMLISALGGASVMGEIVTNVGGLPKSAVTMKIPIVCVAGTNAGKVGRVRINTDGKLLFNEVTDRTSSHEHPAEKLVEHKTYKERMIKK